MNFNTEHLRKVHIIKQLKIFIFLLIIKILYLYHKTNKYVKNK
jgi:hypothetical protein